MRVDSRSPAPSPASAAPPRGAAAARFSLGQAPAAGAAGKAAAAAPLVTLDALLAVQGEGDPPERRRRSLRRGQDLLESLDRLKAALLAGRLGAGQLQALAGQLGRAGAGSSGDPGLDDVVAQIELRAQVELAKLRRA
jgi:Class II flagellar assembly regulator